MQCSSCVIKDIVFVSWTPYEAKTHHLQRCCLTYLCTRGISCTGPCGGRLRWTVGALGGQPSAAVRVAEALAVLFADLREQTALSLHCWLYIWLSLRSTSSIYSLYQHTAPPVLKFNAFHLEWRVYWAYFFLKKAVEDEDKHSLESVEDGEEVGHDYGSLVDEE